MDIELVVCSDTELRRRMTADVHPPVLPVPLATGGEALALAHRLDVRGCRVAPPLSDMGLLAFVACWRGEWPDRPLVEGVAPAPVSVQVGTWTVDTATLVAVRGDRRVPLTALEVRLLGYLAAREGSLVSRAELLTEVWGYAPDSTSRAVDHGLRRLRAKLDSDPDEPALFEGLRAAGVRLGGTLPSTSAGDTPLIGRDTVLDAIDRARAHGARLVSLTGPAGVGRTAVLSAWATAAGVPVAMSLSAESGPVALDDWSGGVGALLAWLSADDERRLVVVATGGLRSRQAVEVPVPPLTVPEARAMWGRIGPQLDPDDLGAVLVPCEGLPARIVHAAELAGMVPVPELIERVARRFVATAPSPAEQRVLDVFGTEFGLRDGPVDLLLLDRLDRMVERGLLVRVEGTDPRFRKV